MAGCAGSVAPPEELQGYAAHERQRWLAWQSDWAGVPHRLGGNSQQGIDCSAFAQRGYQELYRINLPRTVKQQRRRGRAIQYQDLQTGDLVFFRQRSYPHHVGIYMGDGSFLHVSSKRGVTRSRLDSGYWKKYFSQGRRVIE